MDWIRVADDDKDDKVDNDDNDNCFCHCHLINGIIIINFVIVIFIHLMNWIVSIIIINFIIFVIIIITNDDNEKDNKVDNDDNGNWVD